MLGRGDPGLENVVEDLDLRALLVELCVALLQLGLELAQLLEQPFPLDHQANVDEGDPDFLGDELQAGERLLDVVGGAEPQRLDGRIHRRVPRHDDAGTVRLQGTRSPQDLEAVHPGQVLVHEQAPEGLARQGLHCLLAARGRFHREMLGGERRRQQLQHGGLVVDHEHGGRNDDGFDACHVPSRSNLLHCSSLTPRPGRREQRPRPCPLPHTGSPSRRTEAPFRRRCG